MLSIVEIKEELKRMILEASVSVLMVEWFNTKERIPITMRLSFVHLAGSVLAYSINCT